MEYFGNIVCPYLQCSEAVVYCWNDASVGPSHWVDVDTPHQIFQKLLKGKHEIAKVLSVSKEMSSLTLSMQLFRYEVPLKLCRKVPHVGIDYIAN